MPDTSILQLSATDLDSGQNALLSYVILDGNSRGFFNITSTGVIVIAKPLDRESQPSFTLNISVSDAGGRVSNTSAIVRISLADANDFSPMFSLSMYTTTIGENANPGMVLLQVTATDTDSTHNIRYSLMKSFGCENFTIDPISGNFSIANSLDYEDRTFYECTVIANDSSSDPRIGMTTVRIYVTDVNDNSPVLNGPFNHTLQENFQTGLVAFIVSAADADTGNNAKIFYAISSAYPSNPFSISAISGEIFVIGNLDFDSSIKEYHLTITATDSGSIRHSSAANYTIYLADSNDNKPIFARTQYSFSVSENQAGAFVGCVTANDADQVMRNKELTYAISSISDNSSMTNFHINSSGCMFTTNSLDREQKSSYQFTVEASDNGTLFLSGYTSVDVTITDLNDNPPVFSMSMYNLTLTEETLFQTTILRLSATDDDHSVNSALTFSILEGNVNNTFSISSNGVITLQNRLDKETMASYALRVYAFDQGSPVMNSSMMVYVTIINSNDFSPVFKHAYYMANVSEFTQVGVNILNVSATDADSEYLTYSIYTIETTASTTFEINSTTGQITLNKSLDYEVDNDYWFTVAAVDNEIANRMGTAMVHIAVINENEFSPQFSEMFATVKVVQHITIGTIIKLVTATDADSGDLGSVIYHLSSPSDLFAINNITGVIYLTRSILFSDPRNITLNITASDRGVPPKYSTNYMIIDITVIDQNDNPAFDNNTYAITVAENTSLHTTILTVKANDVDVGANGQLSYSLVSTEIALPFVINSSTGAVSVNQTLDQETLSSYEFFVQVQDGGSPKGIAITRINVIISDVNDVTPSWIDYTHSINISEYFPVGTDLLTVTAIDADAGSNGMMIYSLVAGNEKGYFALNTSSGVITLQKPLDNENTAIGTSFILNITVTDMGTPSLVSPMNALVSIRVINVDDNQPIFDKSYYITTIPEDMMVYSSLLAVHATDKDGDSITYRIRSSNYSDWFSMQGNNITLAKNIDYENVSNIYLTVEAVSGGVNLFVGTTQVEIVIADINDNYPIMSSVVYYANISEQSVPGQLVAAISASDADSSLNGRLSFYIDSPGPFDILTDHNRGLIYLTSTLNYESIQFYQIVVNVSDNGSPQKWALQQATVNVTIQDVNDNNPVFFESSYNVSLYENITVGSVVIKVNASDADNDNNGYITYMIANTEPIPFAINSSTGTVTLTKSLVYKLKGSYEIIIVARDGGTPAREGRTVISVNVVAQNLDNPVFLVRHYNVSIREGILVGSFVTQVQAADNDTPDQTLVFSFSSGNSESKFRIDNQGKVYVNGTIDREMTSFYNLSVSLSDGGIPPRTASEQAEVLIYILDINDNTPVFNASEYSKTVSEDTSGGTSILTVVASDNDYGNNSKIIYSFLDLTMASMFSLNSENGEISLVDKLNYSETHLITFFIVASDYGSSPRSSSVKVVITVLDVNEMPYFMPQTYSINVTEALHVGSSILTVTAKDKDSYENAVVIYNITGGNINDKFKINTMTGVISLKSKLDADPNGQSLYTLKISATDNASIPLTAIPSATVIIHVFNLNEHQPLFSKSIYEFTIPENKTVGVLEIAVNATDKDGDQITYSLINSPYSSYFAINNMTGQLSLSRNVDFESIKKLVFMVRATDNVSPSFHTDAQVIFYITDVNDNEPSFNVFNYTSYITINALVGSILVNLDVTDQDSGVNGKIKYQFVNAPSSLPFEIIGSTIRVKTSLANTNMTWYALSVVAVDQGSPSLSSSNANVNIYVSPNSTVPHFVKPFYNITIQDNITSDMVILQVHAMDTDLGPYSKITYVFEANEDSSLFTINETTGEIKPASNGVLNFGLKTRHVLIVKATDGSGFFDKTMIYIDIEDTNDRHPLFQKTNYVVAVPESTSVGMTLLQVSAEDGDTGQGGQVIYQIDSGNTNLMFNITADGTILLAKKLSPDGPTNYTLVIVARDNGVPPQYSTNNVTVLFDIRLCLDYTPTFNQTEYSYSVAENHAPEEILQVFGSSRLAGGSLCYYVVDNKFNDTFAINSTTGVIGTLKALNREMISSYTFVVGVTNTLPNSQSDHAIVIITVSDMNDNSPHFIGSSQSVSLSESIAPGRIVATVSAVDDDDGQHAKVNYTIVSGNTNMTFSINNQGQIIILKSLDHETKSQYNLLINASDLGSPAMMATESFSLQLNILNENDYSPNFNQTVYSAVYPETVQVNSSILTVLANDVDGDNLYYSIPDPAMQSFFKVDTTTGLVSVIVPLDYDSTSVYRFAVEVSDGGMPARRDFAMVDITLTDVNDNPPFLPTTLYSATISEEAAVGSTVLIVSASDRDSGNNGKLVFNIIGVEPSNPPFALSDKGILTVNSSLDYENTEQFNLTISVHDLGSSPSYARDNITAVVHIKNENDNLPVFDKPLYNKTLAEKSSAISSIIQVHATDDDRLTILEYSILDPRLRSVLHIDTSTGFISAPNGLDFEAMKSLRFAVQVSDGGKYPLKAFTFVAITLTDVNDNSPEFSASQYNVSLQHSFPSHIPFIAVSATDKDSGINADITFQIDSITPNLTSFIIDSTNGGIYFKGNLTGNTTYTLVVKATDGGGNYGTTKVRIIMAARNGSSLSLPSNVNATTITTIEVAIDIGKYVKDFDQRTRYDILVQEYHPDDPDSKFCFFRKIQLYWRCHII